MENEHNDDHLCRVSVLEGRANNQGISECSLDQVGRILISGKRMVSECHTALR